MAYDLAVHGYRPDPDNVGLLNQIIIRDVLRIENRYRFIFLPAGWHDPRATERPTTGERMEKALIEARPRIKEKLVTQYSVWLNHLMPARNTFEEVETVGEMARALTVSYEHNNQLDALGIWFMVPRITHCHRVRHSPATHILSSASWAVLKSSQFYAEPLARILFKLEPDGLGRLTANNLARRTVSNTGYIPTDHRIWQGGHDYMTRRRTDNFR